MTTDNLVPRAIETASTDGRGALTAETVGEFCEALGISRSFAYRLAKRGDLRFVKLGARTLVPLSERARVLSSRSNGKLC
ncbi:MAG: helix-turn-helix domain-containing protein [Reyranella sp.]|uniref:helix-turn-helix domain-containing protein n=1 Tax=Reyranella sp. TaxID=1929291 RepID=UPI003452247D|nr:helix-turn-helix domain-containing protein [Reyranella sp.]